MASDWIKIECTTPRKSEVLKVARILGITTDDAFGKIVRFWMWADSNSVDGLVDGAASTDVDTVVDSKGFANALKIVGWLEIDEENETIRIPNFENHNGESAKKRGLRQKRQQKWRDGNKHVDTQASTTASQKRLPELELDNKERESAGAREVSIPTLQEIVVAADRVGMTESEAKRFFEHYEGNNLWINQHGRLIKWQTKLSTWKTNERKYDGNKNINGRHARRIDNNAGTFNEGKTGQYATTKLGRVT